MPRITGDIKRDGDYTVLDSSVHPPLVIEFHYHFMPGYFSNDLLEAFPCYAISIKLRDLIQGQSLSGYSIAKVIVTKDVEANTPLDYVWLKVNGGPEDDFHINDNHILTVSDRAFEIISLTNISECGYECI